MTEMKGRRERELGRVATARGREGGRERRLNVI